MRITNRMMTNNSLGHINNVKTYEDTLTTQMATGKKINRASESPVIAIRALRLRTSVTETTQYYKYNAADAKQWLSITESSLDDVADLLSNAIQNMEKGSNNFLQSSDRVIIADQLDAIVDEIYTAGNADYAGRTIFTGYRTDTPLSFTANENTDYTITEFFEKEDIETIGYIGTANLFDLTKSNLQSSSLDELSITNNTVSRIRLAYDTLKTAQVPKITVTAADGTKTSPTVSVKSITGLSEGDVDKLYDGTALGDDEAFLIPETGELLLGKNVAQAMRTSAGVSVEYQKDSFVTGNLRPEHYFACSTNDGGKVIEYNVKKDEDGNLLEPEEQVITYDVGANQIIRVNSNARECFTHSIGNTAKELRKALEKLQTIETQQKMLEEVAADTTSTMDKDELEKMTVAAQKAFDLQKNQVQELFEDAIQSYQTYLNNTNLALTSCGTRSAKLELISERLQAEKTQTEELKSQNEDIDITETTVLLKSANTTYEAALMATSKIMNTSLLNYL